VGKIKYLGILIDIKLKFNEHIKYITERCTKLVNALSKSARISWGLKHEALKTIYDGGILLKLLYAGPVWIECINNECNKVKYVRVQRIISLRIAKSYHTISHKALRILTEITLIHMKVQEVATQYNITTGINTQKYRIDKAETPINWLHPADVVSVNDTKDEGEENWWNNFTDGRMNKKGVASWFAVFAGKVLAEKLKFKLDDLCSNNQAQQLAIVKALEALEM